MSEYLNLKPVEFEKLSQKAQAAFKWEGRVILPKFDGCFAMVCFWNGKEDFILSREGKEVTSMRHAFDQLIESHPWVLNTKGGVAFLGEAWGQAMEFKKISGLFRRDANQAELIFVPFDIVDYTLDEKDLPVLASDSPYILRLVRLGIDPVMCAGQGHAIEYAQRLKNAGGFDGAVVSDPHATYTPGSGRCGSFIKVKPLQSFTLRVIGIEAAKGAVTGRDTAVLVVAFKGTTCKVGTGFTPNEAAEWIADPRLIIGHFVEVGCMAVYSGPTGLMREPRYYGIRTDVLKPDY